MSTAKNPYKNPYVVARVNKGPCAVCGKQIVPGEGYTPGIVRRSNRATGPARPSHYSCWAPLASREEAMTTPTVEYRAFHPNPRDCREAAWVPDPGQPPVFSHNPRGGEPILNMPSGHYQCPGHPLQGPATPILRLEEVKP